MFTEKKSPFTTAKSWIEGKLGSWLIGSAIGYSLYHFGIISKLTNYLTNLTKKTTAPINTESTTTQQ